MSTMKSYVEMAEILDDAAIAYGSLTDVTRSGSGTEEDPYVYTEYPPNWSIIALTLYINAKTAYDNCVEAMEDVDDHSPLFYPTENMIKDLDQRLNEWIIKYREFFDPVTPTP